MKREWFVVLGVGLLVVFGAVTALFGTTFWATPIRAVQGLLLIAGGLAFVWGGRGEVRYDLEPIRLIGLGNVALGGVVILNAVSTLLGGVPSETAALTAALAAAVGGFALVFIGGGLYRGGDAIEIEFSDEPILNDR
ncbi:MAG: hypothetical protein PPP55_00840 [Halorubrum sp.]